MKKEARLLLNRAIDSLLLAIEHFNRPWDRGRTEAVLMLLDHSFEMLLKSAIVHKGATIRERRATQTIGFDPCIRKCLSDAQVKCLTETQALTIRTLNGLRDGAYHYIIKLPEQMLYIYTQAGVTVFADILREVFQKELGDFMPGRVLPISTELPSDLVVLMDREFHQIQNLLTDRMRRGTEAKARVRALAIIENVADGSNSQPGEGQVKRLINGIRTGQDWNTLFPAVASLKMDTEGSAMKFSIRISKADGFPVRVVQEGEDPAAMIAVKRVDELGYYNLGLRDLAKHLGLGPHIALAVIKHLGLQDDPEYFKEFRIGSSRHKRYSPKALSRLRDEIPKLNIPEIWQKWKPRRRVQSSHSVEDLAPTVEQEETTVRSP